MSGLLVVVVLFVVSLVLLVLCVSVVDDDVEGVVVVAVVVDVVTTSMQLVESSLRLSSSLSRSSRFWPPVSSPSICLATSSSWFCMSWQRCLS